MMEQNRVIPIRVVCYFPYRNFRFLLDFLALWNAWENWGKCDEPCGTGSRRRIRTCPGVGCVGGNNQDEECNTKICTLKII